MHGTYSVKNLPAPYYLRPNKKSLFRRLLFDRLRILIEKKKRYFIFLIFFFFVAYFISHNYFKGRVSDNNQLSQDIELNQSNQNVRKILSSDVNFSLPHSSIIRSESELKDQTGENSNKVLSALHLTKN